MFEVGRQFNTIHRGYPSNNTAGVFKTDSYYNNLVRRCSNLAEYRCTIERVGIILVTDWELDPTPREKATLGFLSVRIFGLESGIEVILVKMLRISGSLRFFL